MTCGVAQARRLGKKRVACVSTGNTSASMAAYAAAEDLIRIGAYQRGADLQLDRAIAALPAINAFLRQKKLESAPFETTQKLLLELPA